MPLPAGGGGRFGGQVSRPHASPGRTYLRSTVQQMVLDARRRRRAAPRSVGVSLCGSCQFTAMLPPVARSFVSQPLRSRRFRTGFAGRPAWREGAGAARETREARHRIGFPGDGQFQGRPPSPPPATPTLPVSRSSPSKAAIRRSNRCKAVSDKLTALVLRSVLYAF